MITAPSLEMYLGTTALQELFLCLAKFDYHQNQKLIPRPSRVRYTMRRGIWLHACLQHHYKGHDWHKVLLVLEAWGHQNGVSEDEIDQAIVECTVIMEGYLAYYAKVTPWKPIIDETAITMAFPEIGLTLAPTIDCLAEWEGGYWLIEYKSTGQIPSPLWRAIDPQTATQWTAVENHFGIHLDGIVFDYLYTKMPTIPRVKKGTKTERPGFYANTSVTSNRMFGEGVKALSLAWDMWMGGNKWESSAEDLRVFNDYVASERLRLVNDGKFFVRQISKRPEAQLLGTMKDIRVKVEEARLAARMGHWPRSFHQKVCPVFCDYHELCAQEYMSGQRSQVIREEMFMLDTGEREGRIEMPSVDHEHLVVVDTIWGEPDGSEAY